MSFNLSTRIQFELFPNENYRSVKFRKVEQTDRSFPLLSIYCLFLANDLV